MWITESQREKLPQYVQTYIGQLEETNHHLTRRLDLKSPSGIKNDEETTVVVGMDGFQERAPDDARVRFQLGGCFTRYFDVFRARRPGALHLRSGRTIAIEPQAANSVIVWINEEDN